VEFEAETAPALSYSALLAGLSYALDLTEGQRPGHSVRSCLIGMRIAEAMRLSAEDRAALFYALIMKDLGCSSNSARFAALFGSHDHDLKMNLKTIDWPRAVESFGYVLRNSAPGAFWLKRAWRVLAVLSRGQEGAREVVRTRCERGADISRMLGLPDPTSAAIRALDEHWDGRGQPYALAGGEIPLLARILNLAQTVDVFFTTHGVLTAYDMAAARRGTWFDPAVVDALFAVKPDALFWRDLGGEFDLDRVQFVAPGDRTIAATEEQLDTVSETFAQVIDAKSPWTYRHSHGVADAADRIAAVLGYTAGARRELRRAALLHDVGKLGVSNLILDKPDRLTDEEFSAMRRHSRYTAEILKRVRCFNQLVPAAAAHHERLDGRGYHQALRGTEVVPEARILCVADICDALSTSRPYRAGLPAEKVLEIMGRDTGTGIDADCFAALKTVLRETGIAVDEQAPAARIVPMLAEDYHQAA
jgi:putative nucleotidyltransferase with HDIG domain